MNTKLSCFVQLYICFYNKNHERKREKETPSPCIKHPRVLIYKNRMIIKNKEQLFLKHVFLDFPEV